MYWKPRRERFREILAGNKCVFTASVYDPITARMAESLGFEAALVAGSAASLTILGAPDLTLVTLSELAALTLRIARASTLPLLVDADHGYGNALNVRRTIEELESAGASVVTIEDTVLPRAFGGERLELVSTDEAVGKMRAALSARQDPALTVVARSAAAEVEGIDAAIARARTYQATGVDALFFTGVTTREHIEAVSEAFDIPLMLGFVPSDVFDVDHLVACGVRVCIQGGQQPFFASMKAAYDALAAFRNGTSANAIGGLAPRELVAEMTQSAEYEACVEEFLKPKSRPR